ncbi:pyridoxamine 5'-phosphate oxidase family protein [Microbacterium sp. DT81.1]|uniref:pyridoxamine 5'-phosphate oxidase family protein n=1 Tax=Microbacterium sp. DT81.1 TaxID=3393413 RepID=UPI003CFA9204
MSEHEPRVEPLTLPREYGRVKHTLRWADVSRRLSMAPHYWLATVRGDGRPHTVPIDGLWETDCLWFGGSVATVHHLNLLRGGEVSVHTEDAMAPVIVEGIAELITPSSEQAQMLTARSRAKYGYGDPAAYASPLWMVVPHRALAWTSFPTDASRFVFGGR